MIEESGIIEQAWLKAKTQWNRRHPHVISVVAPPKLSARVSADVMPVHEPLKTVEFEQTWYPYHEHGVTYCGSRVVARYEGKEAVVEDRIIDYP